jgi:hypothetical protein
VALASRIRASTRACPRWGSSTPGRLSREMDQGLWPPHRPRTLADTAAVGVDRGLPALVAIEGVYGLLDADIDWATEGQAGPAVAAGPGETVGSPG